MNEAIFLLHLLAVTGATLFAFRRGKETLIAWVGLQAVLANFFVLKQISLFGYTITCSDSFAIGTIFGINLLREYAGAETANRALTTSFILMGLFIVMSQIHLLYTPSPLDFSQAAYHTLLAPSPRLLFASLFTFALVQKGEVLLFTAIKNRFPRVPFALRNMTSTTLSQMVDTALFSFLGLYGIVSCLTSVMIMSFVTKMLIISLTGPLLAFAKQLAPKTGYDLL